MKRLAEEEKEETGAPIEAEADETADAVEAADAVENTDDVTSDDETSEDDTSDDEDEVDYDAVSIDEAETGDEDDATDDDDEEDEDDADEDDSEPEYSTGAPPGDVERNSGLGAAAGQPELADALGNLPASDQSERQEIPGAHSYELIYIGRSSASDTIDEVATRVTEMIEAGEGAIDYTRKSELRRLAYPIEKETEGYYIVINGRFNPTALPELERMLKLEERILRYMIIREDS